MLSKESAEMLKGKVITIFLKGGYARTGVLTGLLNDNELILQNRERKISIFDLAIIDSIKEEDTI